jgi:hypothetical protein
MKITEKFVREELAHALTPNTSLELYPSGGLWYVCDNAQRRLTLVSGSLRDCYHFLCGYATGMPKVKREEDEQRNLLLLLMPRVLVRSEHGESMKLLNAATAALWFGSDSTDVFLQPLKNMGEYIKIKGLIQYEIELGAYPAYPHHDFIRCGKDTTKEQRLARLEYILSKYAVS